MAKIVVKIVTQVPSAGGTGGFADYRMLRPFKADIVDSTNVAYAGQITGGVLPITQAEYDLVVA